MVAIAAANRWSPSARSFAQRSAKRSDRDLRCRAPGSCVLRPASGVLITGGFDGFVETVCQPITRRWVPRRCRRDATSACTWSVIFEGIRCSDSMSLREFFCGWRTGRRLPITRGITSQHRRLLALAEEQARRELSLATEELVEAPDKPRDPAPGQWRRLYSDGWINLVLYLDPRG